MGHGVGGGVTGVVRFHDGEIPLRQLVVVRRGRAGRDGARRVEELGHQALVLPPDPVADRRIVVEVEPGPVERDDLARPRAV